MFYVKLITATGSAFTSYPESEDAARRRFDGQATSSRFPRVELWSVESTDHGWQDVALIDSKGAI